jgi:hypothetical protein
LYGGLSYDTDRHELVVGRMIQTDTSVWLVA